MGVHTPSPPTKTVRAACLACLAFTLIAVAYTWPLLAHIGSVLPSDPADPVFNAAILRWNAHTVPFSSAWWNAPHYYPTQSVAAFTENLEGISLIASPVLWITGSPLIAYNVVFFLTWPLSALAVFLLVDRLTGRRDAAFVGGLAYAFTPYRTAEIAHVQSLSAYWLPFALYAAHAYLQDGRRRWLAAFAVAWLLQSLSNGHYLLFGAVLVGCWLLWFGTRAGAFHRTAILAAVWVAASLPLVPVLLEYAAVHARYGLKREYAEILAYSARLHSWFEVTGDAWLWRRFVPVGKDALFPGIGAVVALLVGAGARWSSAPGETVSRTRRIIRAVLVIVTVAATVAALIGLWRGPWTMSVSGLTLRVANLNRAAPLALLGWIAIAALTPRIRMAVFRRSPLLFYTAMTAIIAVLCMGPVLQAGDVAMLRPAPYGWLMALPGFNELRVPPRFWMLGIMCLAVAAGLALSALADRWRSARLAVVAIGVLVLADGWMPTMRLAAAPPDLAIESGDRLVPFVELPLGVDWDWDAVFRAAGNRRRVFNGVSGYDPPHYDALRAALMQHDPAIIPAMATLGEFDAVVNMKVESAAVLVRDLEAAGARLLREEDGRRLYRVPAQSPPKPLGAAIPVAAIQAVRASELFAPRLPDIPALHDGDLSTGWDDYPQTAGQWIDIDLGRVRDVGGVMEALGDRDLAYPRRLQIDTSIDRQLWTPAWTGAGMAPAFLALVAEPLEGRMAFRFESRPARYVRVRQLDDAPREWHISELSVHAP